VVNADLKNELLAAKDTIIPGLDRTNSEFTKYGCLP
jgi:hypothetical protein